MSLEADNDTQEDPIGEQEAETSKRSERKKEREKKRRGQISNAFEELAAFISQVEPEESGGADPRKKRRKSEGGGAGGDANSGRTRLDLISRALTIMKRLHSENEERKRIIASMQGHGANRGSSNDNVSE